MLGHRTGMIGFPLRLLARENYDRVVARKGAGAVALITGEERIVPPQATYFVCTVESMPLEREVGFLAIDEVQLAADPERGHIFTARLLEARGRDETMFLGADTIRPLLRRLVPEAKVETRPRFSRLTYAGPRKLARLPRRSAVVAFSAAEVYELAEFLRRTRGGAAVVLGALSPRTRNAQVALFQAGEVDYLVATDAIGMGLNMDIDHVAFASLAKFDGEALRRLKPPELAQIAGRAGRHMTDGTFGLTAEAGQFDPAIVEAIEAHRFDPLTQLCWRSTALQFGSLEALLQSLEMRPPRPEFRRGRDADDYVALKTLARDPEIAARTESHTGLRLLWDCCQIPDFRKILPEAHARLVGQVFRLLLGNDGNLPEDWIARQIARVDRIDGDIDTLLGRIAHVRTLTYLAYRADWVERGELWQERTRALEDKLSDTLHDRLTQRFIDRRSAAISRRRESGEGLLAAIARTGEVTVEGEPVGRIDGLIFRPDGDISDRATKAAINRALPAAIALRAARLAGDGDAAFSCAGDGTLLWQGGIVGRLAPGRDVLAPRIEPVAPPELASPAREAIRRRLADWLQGRIGERLRPLVRLRDASLAGSGRGLAYRLCEALGNVPRRETQAQIAGLAPEDRRTLQAIGLRFGQASVFVPRILKPAALELRALLWAAHRGVVAPRLPPPGRVSIALDPAIPWDYYLAIGYQPTVRQGAQGRAVRVDILERIAELAGRLARTGPFVPPAAMVALTGCPAEELPPILALLGFRPVAGADSAVAYARARRRTRPADGRHISRPDSAFADLVNKFRREG
jgi:ATP-dependent RNA helicase SUPV3L1/SUV3